MFSKSYVLRSTLRRSHFSSNVFRSSTTSIVRTIAANNKGRGRSFYPSIIALGISSSVALQMTSGAEGGKDLDKFSNTALYPLGTIIEKGMLKVSEKHSISYSVYGNPKGINTKHHQWIISL
jgi:hypothetical protein